MKILVSLLKTFQQKPVN